MTQAQPDDTLNIKDQLAWVKLSLVPTVGGQRFCQLLNAFGQPDQIFAASQAQLSKVVSQKTAQHIKAATFEEQLAATENWLAEPDNHIITLADEHYPKRLLEISDPPPLLYAKGNTALLNQHSLAMVGGRNATKQGESNAENFAQAISDQDYCIVSGMALGIDGAAHRGALAGSGKTIAVVGTGLDIVYPAKHRELAHQIAQSGLLLSEFPLGTPSISANFPKRNRIISGLSAGCLVVEANTNSGSLITARLAAEQGREVYAIPGSIHSPMAKGCHQLIKQGAKLVESTQDVLEELPTQNIDPIATQASVAVNNEDQTEKSVEHPLIQFIGFEPTHIELIVQRSGLSTQEVSAELMLLTLENQVEALAGQQYQRLK